MTDTISLTGLVATTPKHVVTATGLTITSFRFASTQRRYDRAEQKWVDGDTNWYTVATFRQLATNVVASVQKGQRVIVTGPAAGARLGDGRQARHERRDRRRGGRPRPQLGHDGLHAIDRDGGGRGGCGGGWRRRHRRRRRRRDEPTPTTATAATAPRSKNRSGRRCRSRIVPTRLQRGQTRGSACGATAHGAGSSSRSRSPRRSGSGLPACVGGPRRRRRRRTPHPRVRGETTPAEPEIDLNGTATENRPYFDQVNIATIDDGRRRRPLLHRRPGRGRLFERVDGGHPRPHLDQRAGRQHPVLGAAQRHLPGRAVRRRGLRQLRRPAARRRALPDRHHASHRLVSRNVDSSLWPNTFTRWCAPARRSARSSSWMT